MAMWKDKLNIITSMVSYNLRIIFANKFIYFMIAAIAFYLLVTTIMLFSDFTPMPENVYGSLIFPGLLIIFYPVLFSVQNDKDSRMLEIVFSIPNYRYKIYLVRFMISMLLLVVVITLMTMFSSFALVKVPLFYMVYQVMFPLLFMACLSFLFATLVKNASGAAVIMVIIGLFFWIMNEPLRNSKWNIFLNPFLVPTDISYNIWLNILLQNRIILVVGSLIAFLWALINLQQREKFV